MTGIVIVGSSVGGVRTAQALRRAGFAGPLVVVGEEQELPYDKPPLSKDFLMTAASPAVPLLSDDEARTAGIDLLLGHRAVSLDIAARRVELDGHEPLVFDGLVIATGARARPSPWRGEGVHELRTLEDARSLRADLERGGHLVVVGAGFIGAEVAGSARRLGLEVTMVDPLAVPAGRQMGDEVGRRLAGLHQRHGVRTRFGHGVESIERAPEGTFTVTLTDGEHLRADTVVVGIGATPNTEWLESSGLLIEDGIVCDELGRAEQAGGIFAVGDVARWRDPAAGRDVRVEHWTNAVDQAAVVAHNLVHPDEPRIHSPVHYVWSDQHDWKIQIVGEPRAGAGHTLVEQPTAGTESWAALYHDTADALVGAVVVNWPRALVACRRALPTRSPVHDVRAQLDPRPPALS